MSGSRKNQGSSDKANSGSPERAKTPKKHKRILDDENEAPAAPAAAPRRGASQEGADEEATQLLAEKPPQRASASVIFMSQFFQISF